jgi:hypothetical protein
VWRVLGRISTGGKEAGRFTFCVYFVAVYVNVQASVGMIDSQESRAHMSAVKRGLWRMCWCRSGRRLCVVLERSSECRAGSKGRVELDRGRFESSVCCHERRAPADDHVRPR